MCLSLSLSLSASAYTRQMFVVGMFEWTLIKERKSCVQQNRTRVCHFHVCTIYKAHPYRHVPAVQRTRVYMPRTRSACASCVWDSLASAWVDLYHAAFVSRQALAQENEQIRISLIQKDLSACQNQLCAQERMLQEKISALESEAMAKKRAKDLPGAKKKMVERRRMQAQLQSLQDSMSTIDLHRNTIERSMLNKTVLDSLRAAGDVLRQMGATREGISSIERVVDDVEEHVETASTITKILAAGSVSGTINTMAIDGVVLDEEELMQELDMLLNQEEEKDEIKGPAMLPSVVPPTSTHATAQQHQDATNPAAAADQIKNKSHRRNSRQQHKQQQQQREEEEEEEAFAF